MTPWKSLTLADFTCYRDNIQCGAPHELISVGGIRNITTTEPLFKVPSVMPIEMQPQQEGTTILDILPSSLEAVLGILLAVFALITVIVIVHKKSKYYARQRDENRRQVWSRNPELMEPIDINQSFLSNFVTNQWQQRDAQMEDYSDSDDGHQVASGTAEGQTVTPSSVLMKPPSYERITQSDQGLPPKYEDIYNS